MFASQTSINFLQLLLSRSLGRRWFSLTFVSISSTRPVSSLAICAMFADKYCDSGLAVMARCRQRTRMRLLGEFWSVSSLHLCLSMLC